MLAKIKSVKLSVDFFYCNNSWWTFTVFSEFSKYMSKMLSSYNNIDSAISLTRRVTTTCKSTAGVIATETSKDMEPKCESDRQYNFLNHYFHSLIEDPTIQFKTKEEHSLSIEKTVVPVEKSREEL